MNDKANPKKDIERYFKITFITALMFFVSKKEGEFFKVQSRKEIKMEYKLVISSEKENFKDLFLQGNQKIRIYYMKM
jgi:hypothetical protein